MTDIITAEQLYELVRQERVLERARTLREVAAKVRKAGAPDLAAALEAEAVKIDQPEWMRAWGAAREAGRRAEPDPAEAYDPTDPKHPGYHDLMSGHADD